MSVEFLKSVKNKPELCHDGNIFYKNHEYNGKMFWGCQYYSDTKCPVRLITEKNVIIKKCTKEHNHLKDEAKVKSAKAYDAIRTLAETTSLTPENIVSKLRKACSEGEALKLPSAETIKRNIRRIRSRSSKEKTFKLSNSKTKIKKLSNKIDSSIDDNTELKLKIIKLAEKIGNRAAARRCGVNEKSIRTWRRMKDQLRAQPAQKCRISKGDLNKIDSGDTNLQQTVKKKSFSIDDDISSLSVSSLSDSETLEDLEMSANNKTKPATFGGTELIELSMEKQCLKQQFECLSRQFHHWIERSHSKTKLNKCKLALNIMTDCLDLLKE